MMLYVLEETLRKKFTENSWSRQLSLIPTPRRMQPLSERQQKMIGMETRALKFGYRVVRHIEKHELYPESPPI